MLSIGEASSVKVDSKQVTCICPHVCEGAQRSAPVNHSRQSFYLCFCSTAELWIQCINRYWWHISGTQCVKGVFIILGHLRQLLSLLEFSSSRGKQRYLGKNDVVSVNFFSVWSSWMDTFDEILMSNNSTCRFIIHSSRKLLWQELWKKSEFVSKEAAMLFFLLVHLIFNVKKMPWESFLPWKQIPYPNTLKEHLQWNKLVKNGKGYLPKRTS